MYPGQERLTETRPFFLTSEFVATLAALAALAVTAASSESLDAGTLWPLATAIVVAYVFGRGFGKANAPSRAFDPREAIRRRGAGGAGSDLSSEEEDRMSTVRRDEYETQTSRPVYVGRGGYGRGGRIGEDLPIETKPFFLTSEFWASVAMIVALAIGAGTSDDIDANWFWRLATAITIGYVLSRGIAKSGTKSRSWDPREDLLRQRASRGED